MIAFLGDVHDLLAPMRDLLDALPPEVRTVVQVGDLWVWPESHDVPLCADGTPREVPRRPRDQSLHWVRPSRDLMWLDGNHHPFWLTRGLSVPTPVAPGLTFLPRGTVMSLPGRREALRVGVLGGGDSVIDAGWRRPGHDWWPDEERVTVADVERLIANVGTAGGIDILVTHTPPASITRSITKGTPPHPSALLVEEAWRALGGGLEDPAVELISGHMHQAWSSERLRVEVLPMLGLTVR